MEYDLFKEWMPSITKKTAYLFDGVDVEATEAKYPAFMITRALSQFDDTVFIANEVNRMGAALDPKLQYDFYYHLVPSKNRFSKWAKATKGDDVALVMECYQVSNKKAEEILQIIDDKELEAIKNYLDKGGRK